MYSRSAKGGEKGDPNRNPWLAKMTRSRRGRDRLVVGLITTYATSAYSHERCKFEHRPDEVYSIHYVIKFVSDLRQVGGSLRILRFPWSLH
jgi:hypothetical protein